MVLRCRKYQLEKKSNIAVNSWCWFQKRETKSRKVGVVMYSPSTAVWRIRLWLCFWLGTQGTLSKSRSAEVWLYQCNVCLMGQGMNYINIIAYFVGMYKYFTKTLASRMMPPGKQERSGICCESVGIFSLQF